MVAVALRATVGPTPPHSHRFARSATTTTELSSVHEEPVEDLSAFLLKISLCSLRSFVANK